MQMRDGGQVFRDEVLRLKRVVGRNAVLRLTPGPGVTVRSVVGIPSQLQGNDTIVGLGDMSEGEQRDIIVKVSAAGRRGTWPRKRCGRTGSRAADE